MLIVFAGLSAAPSAAQNGDEEQCFVRTGFPEDFFSLSGRQLRMHSGGKYAMIDGQVQLQGEDYRLRADRVVYDEKIKKVQARDDVMFTRCDPRDPDWFITADRVTLDREQGEARVKNAWFVFGGVPLFYLPRYWLGLEKQRTTENPNTPVSYTHLTLPTNREV